VAEPRIFPRLVPSPLWGVGLRSDKTVPWRAISSRMRGLAGHRCEICGGSSEGAPSIWKTCCDEVWAYDHEHRTAYLVDLRVLCWWCNAVTHYGFTVVTSLPHTIQAVLEHGARLNGLPVDDMHKICALHRHHHAEASRHTDWTIDWDDWQAVFVEAQARLQATSPS